MAPLSRTNTRRIRNPQAALDHIVFLAAHFHIMHREAIGGASKSRVLRVYLFGYFADGYMVFDAAIFESTYFAGRQDFCRDHHTCLRLDCAEGGPQNPNRHDRDQFFTLEQGRCT